MLGDPTAMQILGARPGIEVMGWSLDLMPQRVFEEAARELARSRPRWVFVHAVYRSDGAAAAVGAPFQPVLRQYYQVIGADERGTWYRTDMVGPTAPDAEGVHLP